MNMTDDITPRHEGRMFRSVIGILALATAIGGFIGLFFIKVPEENRDAMMFALGAVFGWAGSVIASEYGASTTGRKVAESVVRNIERQDAVLADVTAEPQEVKVVNSAEDPAKVKVTETVDTPPEDLPDYAKP